MPLLPCTSQQTQGHGTFGHTAWASSDVSAQPQGPESSASPLLALAETSNQKTLKQFSSCFLESTKKSVVKDSASKHSFATSWCKAVNSILCLTSYIRTVHCHSYRLPHISAMDLCKLCILQSPYNHIREDVDKSGYRLKDGWLDDHITS